MIKDPPLVADHNITGLDSHAKSLPTGESVDPGAARPGPVVPAGLLASIGVHQLTMGIAVDQPSMRSNKIVGYSIGSKLNAFLAVVAARNVVLRPAGEEHP